jgi:hypothetical protein
MVRVDERAFTENAARSRTLRSSRTFPGQSYRRRACRASRVRPAADRPKDLPISYRNALVSGRMFVKRFA